jgi:putative effector of murein hydrolase LrgA (UPF0299 family)
MSLISYLHLTNMELFNVLFLMLFAFLLTDLVTGVTTNIAVVQELQLISVSDY